MNEPKRKPPIVQLILLGVLLFVFPIGSYLYLKAGYNYQLASWNEIDPQVAIAEVLSYPRPDSSLDVIFFAGAQGSDSVQQAIRSVHEAFDDNPSVRFVGIGAQGASGIEDAEQVFVLPESPRDPVELELALAPFSLRCEGAPFRQRAYLVDRDGQLRRCYDLHSGVEVNRLVEQLALLIPRPREEDIVLERKTEL